MKAAKEAVREAWSVTGVYCYFLQTSVNEEMFAFFFFRYHTHNVGGADPECVNDWSRYLPDDWHQSRMLHLLPYVMK